jgi:hypothetical protein
MGSLFTNGGRIKDVIGHDLWINHKIFHKFQFSFCIFSL